MHENPNIRSEKNGKGNIHIIKIDFRMFRVILTKNDFSISGEKNGVDLPNR